jgi:hypothetical protein
MLWLSNLRLKSLVLIFVIKGYKNHKRIERLYYGASSDYAGKTTSRRNKVHKVYPYLLRNLKIDSSNQDNQPLTIDTIKVKGYEHELIARFAEQASYFLTYGNKTAASPHYDLDCFADKIPETLLALELGY